MEKNLVQILKGRRALIRRRWEVLLRAAKASDPLANPDALVHLMDWTIDQVAHALRQEPARRPRHAPGYSAAQAACRCGHNPLLAYFLAGEQALIEVVAEDWKDHETTPPETAVAEVYLAFHSVAGRELGSFCAFCQHRDAFCDTREPAHPGPNRIAAGA
jgi:hypothetical protein